MAVEIRGNEFDSVPRLMNRLFIGATARLAGRATKRAMELTAPENMPAEIDPSLREALAWVIRLHSGQATSDDADAVLQWRAQSGDHEDAFREAVRLWRTFGDGTRQLHAQKQPALGATGAVGATRALLSRRGLVGGAIAASAVAYFAVRPPYDLWPSIEETFADYRTAKGERRVVAVSPNISLKLNTQTSVSMRGTDDQPQIELISGEASISVKGADLRPLTVRAANGVIKATQADFNTRCLDGVVSVCCVEGMLEISCGDRSAVLRKGNEISYSNNTGLGVAEGVDPSTATAWQDGYLIVRGWPLTKVVSEINRYRPGKIVVVDSALGRRVVTGTFYLDHLDDFVDQARDLFGAHVRSLPAGLIFLS
jgi:transmembrane sensor